MAQTTIVIVGDRDVARFRGWLIRDMVAADCRVVVCAPPQPMLAPTIAAFGGEYVPVSLNQTGINPARDAVDILLLGRVMRRVGADIVLSHSTKPNFIGPLAAWLAGVREVYAMIEGLGYAFTEGRELKRRALRQVVSRMLRFSLQWCSAVFVLNETDEEFVRSARLVGTSQRVVRVNGTGIDLSEFAYAPAPAGMPSFLLIARLLREKGICEYVEAARKLKSRVPGCRFRILGPADSNPGALSPRQVAAWQAEGVIEYLGETSDVRPFLEACTTYVLPSYREGMPRTIMEAMAVGRSIVTTDVPGCRDTTVHGLNGFIVPARDPESLALAMQSFIDDPSLVSRMGAASRVIAEQRFDVKKVNANVMNAMSLRAA